MKVAIITASTAVYKGEQEDASGKVIRKRKQGLTLCS